MVRIKFTEELTDQPAVIRIVGLGGGGGNAVDRMIEAGVSHVEFIVANTDSQVLRKNKAPVKLQLGERLTRGLGVGGNPAVGRQAAEESRDRIREVLVGADMVFVTAGMGGGTGTGSAPYVAQIARELNPAPLIVAVVTRPFEFEGPVRRNQADAGIAELRKYADTLLSIPNERLYDVIDEKTNILAAFRKADDVLRQAVQAITDVITRPGMVNVDFADVRSIMLGSGEALMGMGEGRGKDRALIAAKQAIHSPLLENVSIDGAKGVLINIMGNKDVTLFEVREAMDYIRNSISPDAHVFYGHVVDDSLDDCVQIRVIATGFPPVRASQTRRRLLRPVDGPEGEPAKGPRPVTPSTGTELLRPAYLRRKCEKLH
ncbi:MAG TPA: cell division protein FtsZ [Elusimicrobiota bacterium]|nr:cell division protein FtsZ [Elusimicrobiota bacterium]